MNSINTASWARRVARRRIGFVLLISAAAALCSLAFGLGQGRAAGAAIVFTSPSTVTVSGDTASTTDELAVRSAFALGTAPDSVSIDVRIDRSFTNKTPVHSGGTCADDNNSSEGPSDPVSLPNAGLLQLAALWSPVVWNTTDFSAPIPTPKRFGIDEIVYRDSRSRTIDECTEDQDSSGYAVIATLTETREFTGVFSVAGLPDGCYSFDVVNGVFGYGEIDHASLNGGFARFCLTHQNFPLTKCLTGSARQFVRDDSINVSIGWASLKDAQDSHFLDVQSGSFSITDATGSIVVSTSWPVGERSHWSWPPYDTTVYPNGKGSKGVQARRIDFGYLVGPLAAGTYTLHARFSIAQGINDGFGAIKPGPWLTIDSCTFVVS